MRQIAVVLMLAAASVLAGCTDEPAEVAPAGVVDPDEVNLQTGKGAVQGLLIDDRFRPLANGVILMQPLGLTTTTNENGEFQFLNIEPGTQTLRVNIDGHEAAPQRVSIKAAEFTDTQVVARRTVNAGGTIMTQEFSVFIPCYADVVANAVVANCVLDLSGDSYRAGFTTNYTGVENVTYLVTEMHASQEGKYTVQVRENDGSSGGGARYAVGRIIDGDYIKMVNQVGVANTEHNHQENNVAWNNTEANPFQTIVFPEGDYRGTVPDNPGANPCCGVGAGFGIRATFIQSVFVGEPEVDVATYCALCS